MSWLELLILLAVAGIAVCLLVLTVRRFARGFREGLRGDAHEERPTLRSVLFGTVLVTLLVLFLLGTALFERNQRDQRYPVGEGMTQLRAAQDNGGTWLDLEAQTAIEAALRQGVGGNPGGQGGLNLKVPGMVAGGPLPPSAVATLRRQGWVVGVGGCC